MTQQVFFAHANGFPSATYGKLFPALAPEYRSVPHTSPKGTRQLLVPLAVVRGAHSRVVMRHHARSVQRMPHGEYLSMPGGHMFPLERPDATVQFLKTLFVRWAARDVEGDSA